MAVKSQRIARTGFLGLLLVVSLALLVAPASAAPTLAMSEPTAGATTNATPKFSGTSSDLVNPVKVLIFNGKSEPFRTLEALPAANWSVQVPALEALPAGAYTAKAEQKELLGLGETATTETVAFTVNTSPPVVTLVGPPTPSKNTTPAFSGTASEETEVVVHVFEGLTEVASASTTASGGKWLTGTLSPALPEGKHTFTAHATEKSGLGNGEGESATVSFEVNTEAPVVTLAQPTTPSKNTTPAFSGTASATTEVVVHIYEGTKAEGTQVSSAAATGTGGSWSSGSASPALTAGKHTFTAVATQESPLGNPEGKSGTVTFEVNTESPTVTLSQPVTPSKNTVPQFSGTASATTQVVVHIYEGTKAQGIEVSTATAVGTGGGWSSGAASPALASGEHTYTALAEQESPIGNPAGKSGPVTFTVDTLPPTVTLAQPTTPSNKTTPSFSGTASENTAVEVHVLLEGTEVASATTTASGGVWSTKTLSKALATGKHSFTAFATEVSGLGNTEGNSSTVSFEVNTLPPTVTLVGPPTPSKNTTPSFSGTASESTEVEVHVFEGATEKANAKTTAVGGKWSTSSLSTALPSGKHTFTARATEVSGLGNGEGESATVSFEVNTESPTVTLVGPPTPSKNTTPAFSGTASEETEVVVHVFEGLTEVASASTTASGGKWSTGTLSPALPEGKHTFTAHATEKSGLGNGEGESATVSFEVNTEAPVVTLAQPTTPSKNTTPAFSGTASENTEVVVHVFEGSNRKGASGDDGVGG